MGLLKQDNMIVRDKECTRKLMSKSKIEVEDDEVGRKLLKDKPEVRDAEQCNKQLSDQLANMDRELLKKLNQLGAETEEIKSDIYRCNPAFSNQVNPIPVENIRWNERFDFLRSTLQNLKSGKSKGDKAITKQLDADFVRGQAQLKERFTSLNYNPTEVIPEDFKICVDCKQFKSNEIKVMVKDGYVLVQGSHDIKLDEHGLIKREFTRRWQIPENVKQDKFSCLLDRYGILTVRAPRKISSVSIPVETEKF